METDREVHDMETEVRDRCYFVLFLQDRLHVCFLSGMQLLYIPKVSYTFIEQSQMAA